MRRFVMFALVAFGVGTLAAGDASAFGKRKKRKAAAAEYAAPVDCCGSGGYSSGYYPGGYSSGYSGYQGGYSGYHGGYSGYQGGYYPGAGYDGGMYSSPVTYPPAGYPTPMTR